MRSESYDETPVEIPPGSEMTVGIYPSFSKNLPFTSVGIMVGLS